MMRFDFRLADQPVLALDGHGLRLEDVVAVARFRRRVEIAEPAKNRVRCCRKMVDVLLDSGEKVYGLTTGFGKLRDVVIERDDVAKLQHNLIRSHSCGVGDPLDEDVVRAAMLLRINTLCRGNSGIRLHVLDQLVAMLNDDVYPFVPAQGSVGASGDLAPLSHLALVLIGDPHGRFFPRAERAGNGPPEIVRSPSPRHFAAIPDASGFAACAEREGWSFEPVELQAKEGLALNNGTQVMCALACLTLFDGHFAVRCSEATAAMSLEAQGGVLAAYDPRVHRARNLAEQTECARRTASYCKGSQILGLCLNSARVQRAGVHLREAGEHLVLVERDLDRAGSEPPASVLDLKSEISALESKVSGLIARGDDGAAGADFVAGFQAQPAREQIKTLGRLLAEVRSDASDLLECVDQPNFPETAETPKVRSALVAALNELDKAIPDSPPVQDDYSFRCFPQVLGCAERALDHVLGIVTAEINAATDNPLLFPPPHPDDERLETIDPDVYARWLEDGRIQECCDSVIGGGNFHGEPIAIGMDYLAIALAEVGNISERRVAHLVDEALSNGLPPFLIASSGLNSGFMIPQYTAAALVSENKTLCHPASVDSIPTSANSEDHVSMGTIAARKAAAVAANVRNVIAIEMLTAYQGLRFREPLQPGLPIRRLVEVLARHVERYDDDRVIAPDIEAVCTLLGEPELLACLLE